MRIFLVPIFSIALIGASDDASQLDRSGAQTIVGKTARLSAPPLSSSVVSIDEAIAAVLGDDECRDRISLARSAIGQPDLRDRQQALPEKPLAIYAVDQRQNGCSVMVMMGNLGDIRHLPLPSEKPLRLIPADLGQ